MNIWDNIKLTGKKLYNRGARALISVISFCAVSSGFVGCSSEVKPKIEEKKAVTSEKTIKVDNPVRQIQYLTDTLEHRSRALLYYSNKKIIRNYVEKNNLYEMCLHLFSHEDWHAHNDEINWRTKYKYTPFEYYKLCMHDEISANIAALLTLRYQYLATSNKQKFVNEHNKGFFAFYFSAIAEGKIRPQSNDPEERKKEYTLIANGTQKSWMDKCAKGYMPSIYSMMQRYVERQGFVKDSRKNYNHVHRYMYNIGGVDFLQYMQQDIIPSDERVFLTDGLRNVKSLNNDGSDIMNNVNSGYNLLQNVSIYKQSEAFQHLLISAKLKYELRNKTADELTDNPKMTDMYYRQIFSKFMKDKTFSRYVNSFPIVNEKSSFVRINDEKEYADIIRQMYSFKGVDLSKSINDFEIKDVPIRVEEFKNFSFRKGVYYWLQPLGAQVELCSDQVKKYNDQKIIANGVGGNEASKSKISGWQFITVPNYRQPILTAATAEDNEKIFKIIKDFDSIPEVLKQCDTQAQRLYYASLKISKNKDSLNFKRISKQNKKIRNNTTRGR
ncbi:MAG: hypothetical protein IJ677_06855 [Alphaproteobacteria bacterium]|nr:hypothetical protein [Alphaproteobacteria bacterium]